MPTKDGLELGWGEIGVDLAVPCAFRTHHLTGLQLPCSASHLSLTVG